MDALADLLQVDLKDPEYLRAKFLAREDHQLLRELVSLRKALGLSQADVAERLGLTQPTIAAFERYDSDPKLSTIRRYAQVVGLLVRHRVEVDDAGGWQSVEKFAPNSRQAPAEVGQRSVVPGEIHADFVLAA